VAFGTPSLEKVIRDGQKRHDATMRRLTQSPIERFVSRLFAIFGIIAVVVVSAFISYSAFTFGVELMLPKGKKTPTIQVQEKILSDAKQSLESLSNYVDAQSKSLKQTEAAVAELKKREQELTPLVKAQQEVVDRLFLEQERRNIQALERERWIGAGIGIVTSLLSTLLVYLTRNFWLKFFRNAKPE